MKLSPTESDSIEDFRRRLDQLLAGEEVDAEALSREDRQALGIARWLAEMNPSAGSRLRYPLRRKLLDRVARSNPSNRVVWPQVASAQPLAAAAWLLQRLAPSLSLLVILIFLMTWSLSGINPAAGLLQPARSTAWLLDGETSAQTGLLPAQTGSPANFAPAEPSPQPIPTPVAFSGSVTLIPYPVNASLTPVLNVGGAPSPDTSGISAAKP